MTERLKAVLIVGPPGAGKTTRARELCSQPGYRRWASLSTRPPRAGEVEGFDYLFVDEAEFEVAQLEGLLLEEVRLPDGTRRGLPQPPPVGALEVLVAIVDTGAVPAVLALFGPGEVEVVLLTASQCELKERMLRRGDSGAEIAMRLAWGSPERSTRD